MRLRISFAFLLCGLTLLSAGAARGDTRELLVTIKSVGPMGEGHKAASQAWRELSKSDVDVLPQILAAIDFESEPLASNWLRSAAEAIASRVAEAGQPLPQKDLESFVLDTKQAPRARRLAYELVLDVDPTIEERLLPDMLQDPGAEFRRDAVARVLEQAKEFDLEDADLTDAQKQEARELYQQALSGAVDEDQVKTVVEALDTLGTDVDIAAHFGFLQDWKMIGPFDNHELVGFDKSYPPEEEIDFEAKYDGQTGEVTWQPVSTENEYGIVDIAEQLSPYKGAVMYATTEFISPVRQEVQIRLGTPNSWKLWVNGDLKFGREEYHRGMSVDQYKVNVNLERGRNVILLKLLQNEQTEDWAQRYQFQLRVSDRAGQAIHPGSAGRVSATQQKDVQ